MFKLDINVTGFDHIERIVEESIASAMKELQPILLNYAKTHHRYENQSGNLTMKTMADVLKTSLTLYNTADYAPYVANGHGTWKGDHWLEKTMEANSDLIRETINKHIQRGLN